MSYIQGTNKKRFEFEQMAHCASLFLLNSERRQLMQVQMYAARNS
jgi:hypothetical protein